MRNDNNAEHDFHAIMNQRTPDFRQLQPNFTIQVVSPNDTDNTQDNNLYNSGNDKRTVPIWSSGTPRTPALASNAGYPHDGHEQHEQPNDGDEQQRGHHLPPACLQLSVSKRRKFSARTCRSQRPCIRIPLFKGADNQTLVSMQCLPSPPHQDHSPVDSPHSLSPPAPQQVVMRQGLHLQVELI